MYVCIHVSMYLFTTTYMYINMYVCICISMYLFTKTLVALWAWRRETPKHMVATPFSIRTTNTSCAVGNTNVSLAWRAMSWRAVWHDSWFIHMCDMTHAHVWHDSFICVTWLMTPSCEHHNLCLSHVCLWCNVPCQAALCDIIQASFTCVTWLMTRSHAWHDSWLIHMCDMTHESEMAMDLRVSAGWVGLYNIGKIYMIGTYNVCI